MREFHFKLRNTEDSHMSALGHNRTNRPGHPAMSAIVQKRTSGLRHGACHARKRARARFPSLAASAMLSKKMAERSTGTVLQGQ